jgi:hypothetical protein
MMIGGQRQAGRLQYAILSNATINYVLFLQLGEDMTRERGDCGGWDDRKELRWN